jgi:NADPH-dependent curcumin reductase CurA
MLSRTIALMLATTPFAGASGGVGSFAVHLAKALGAARLTGICGPSNVELVRGLGADTVIGYTREDFTRRPERLRHPRPTEGQIPGHHPPERASSSK